MYKTKSRNPSTPDTHPFPLKKSKGYSPSAFQILYLFIVMIIPKVSQLKIKLSFVSFVYNPSIHRILKAHDNCNIPCEF